MIDVRGLSHCFGPRKVLSDLSFSLETSGFAFLTGPSGSGKTTLLRILHGSLPLQTGRAVAAGVSPLTDTLFDAQLGGRLAFELAKSGLMGLAVTGRADMPSGLIIEDGRASLLSSHGVAPDRVYSDGLFPVVG